MKNIHLEHPEDMVLHGKEHVKEVINYLRNVQGDCSVKYDGAPAIVWGFNPENDKFFVATKSIFNKKKVLINYTHHDIEVNHGNNANVASILHVCFDNLPRVDGVYQCDFIGFGGSDTYSPNTITYRFPNVIDTNIVVAVHTAYAGDTIKDLTAQCGVDLSEIFSSNDKVRFLDTNAYITSRRRRVNYILGLADLVSNFVKYPTQKEAVKLQILVNKCIRDNRVIDVLPKGVSFIFDLITDAKQLLMQDIHAVEDVKCVIDYGFDYENCGHEGYVHSNQFGTYKLVNRRVFSHYNFNLPKKWQSAR